MLYLNWASAIFAFLAAVFWMRSAMMTIPDARNELEPEFARNAKRLTKALKASARWNSLAAGSACISAVLTGLTQVLGN